MGSHIRARVSSAQSASRIDKRESQVQGYYNFPLFNTLVRSASAKRFPRGRELAGRPRDFPRLPPLFIMTMRFGRDGSSCKSPIPADPLSRESQQSMPPASHTR
jgi:hypothetical protein